MTLMNSSKSNLSCVSPRAELRKLFFIYLPVMMFSGSEKKSGQVSFVQYRLEKQGRVYFVYYMAGLWQRPK